MGDGLLHDGGVDRHPLQAARIEGPGLLPGQDRLRQHPLHPFLPNPLAPTGQRRRVNRRPMLKERLAGEVLVIGIFDPTRDHRLVRESKRVLQIEQPGDHPGRRGRAAGARGEEPGPLRLEHLPVDQRGEFHQLVARVDHVDQTRAQQVVLFRRAGVMLHAADRIAGFRAES